MAAMAVLVVGACTGGGGATQAPAASEAPAPASEAPAPASEAPASAAPASEAPAAIGPGEGELNLIAWAGYVEQGKTYPEFDWVTSFEEKTGCIVNETYMTDSNNGVALMQSGQYDGISASGDATTRLIKGGLVAPIDTSMLPNYANVFAGLKDLPHNTVDGVNYGVPHGRGPNLLMYNTETFPEAPTSWASVWEDGAKNKGKVSIYDSSIYIADAALHLMTTRPELGITNPYQLNEAQFAEAIKLLEQQRDEADPLYWSVYTDQMASYANDDVVTGTSWQLQANLLQGENEPVAAVLPDEGSTGWSDTWMMHVNAKHPNCMLLWMDHMMSAEANGQATVYFGEAPTSQQACDYAETIAAGHCEQTHATDEAYYDKVWYWSTPQEDCADADAATTCKTQEDWVKGWTQVVGS
jgi:putative spermidine/putrescine transport system substrate-binding protein